MKKLIQLTPGQLEQAASMLKAIAHPVRIAIVNQLDGDKKLAVKEIHESLQIEQSSASHHLGILKDKGILLSRRDGKNTLYYLKDANFSRIIDCLGKCTCI